MSAIKSNYNRNKKRMSFPQQKKSNSIQIKIMEEKNKKGKIRWLKYS